MKFVKIKKLKKNKEEIVNQNKMSSIPCENIDNNSHSNECQEQSSDNTNYSDIDLDVNNEFETKSLIIFNNVPVGSEAIRYNLVEDAIVLPINRSKNDDPYVKQKPFRTVCCKYSALSNKKV